MGFFAGFKGFLGVYWGIVISYFLCSFRGFWYYGKVNKERKSETYW